VDPMNDDMVTQQHLESQETQAMRYFELGRIKYLAVSTQP
jgi:predicted DNA-binding transcriptional regulator YafY